MQQELPQWLPQDAWIAFIQMRKAIRKPLTEYAKKLAIKKLEQLKAEGNSPEEVLNQSILNDWQGLFEVKKSGGNGSGKPAWEKPDLGACAETAAFIRKIGSKASPSQQEWLKRWDVEHRV
jgi:hypothetical protein